MLKDDIFAIRDLFHQKLLHWRIIYRLTILTAYSVGFIAVASYHFFIDSLPPVTSIVMFAIGFPIGLFLVSRMFGIYWDEERGMITSGRMDSFGIAMIILYIALRVWLNDALDYVLHPGAVKLSGLAFCLIAGIMAGRLIATVISVRNISLSRSS